MKNRYRNMHPLKTDARTLTPHLKGGLPAVLPYAVHVASALTLSTWGQAAD